MSIVALTQLGMRPALLVLVALTLLACGSQTSGGVVQEHRAGARGSTGSGKHALVIAIGDYPRDGGYPPIHAGADIPLVVGALEQHGFSPEVLADEAATLSGLRGALEKFSRDVNPGDVVVIHYSGHGHRIADQPAGATGDTVAALDESDGYDEVWVPWDAPAKPPAGYDGAGHLRDDELSWHLGQIRKALGPDGHLLVTIDACFSGTATRGLPVRGVEEPIGPPLAGASRTSRRLGAELAGARGQLAPIVVISASSDHELAFETRDEAGTPVGSLSLAMARTLPGLESDATYAGWFEALSAQLAVLAPRQTPTLEGAVDAQVLSGQVEKRPAHMVIVEDEEGFRLKGGALYGAIPGTRVSVFEPDSAPGDSAPLARARVTSFIGADAVLELTEGATASLDGTWAYVTLWGVADGMDVYLDDTLTDPSRAALVETLAQVQRVSVVARADEATLMIERRSDGAWLTAMDGRGDLLGPFDATDVSARRPLRAAVLRWARGQVVRSLRMEHPGLDVSLRLIPAQESLMPGECEPLTAEASPGTGRVLGKGQPFLLEFENRGRKPAFTTVLNIVPDGSVTQLWPLHGEQPDDLPPGATWQPPGVCFFAGEEQGTEVFKLIATAKPVDFRPVISSRGEGEAPSSPLEQLLFETWTDSRGARGVPAGVGMTDEIGIVVR